MTGIVLTCICIYFISVNGEVERPVETDTTSCSAEGDCDVRTTFDDSDSHEKAKYLSEITPGRSDTQQDDNEETHSSKLNNVPLNIDSGNTQTREYKPSLSTENLKGHKEPDTTDDEDVYQPETEEENIKQPATDGDTKTSSCIYPPDFFEFPPLTRLDPVKVGHEVNVELDGKMYKRITRAIKPPVFEVRDILSPEECQQFIDAGKKKGLETSNLFGEDVHDEMNKTDLSEITRISDQAWLGPDDLPETWQPLIKRLAALMEMPTEFVQRSEPIQLVRYLHGGHYHAHLDTTDTSEAGATDLPCCFQIFCGEKEDTAALSECCRLCRYLTVMYYLSDVEKGGETAFPLADMEDELFKEKTEDNNQQFYNLSKYCYNSSLIVTPRKGSAIFWYTHFRDEETGYLGKSDMHSFHGGCDIIKGTKWIANSFISAPTYEDRFKPSEYWLPGP